MTPAKTGAHVMKHVMKQRKLGPEAIALETTSFFDRYIGQKLRFFLVLSPRLLSPDPIFAELIRETLNNGFVRAKLATTLTPFLTFLLAFRQ